MQARVRLRMNIDSGLFVDIFKHALIKIHLKHVPTLPKVSGFHLRTKFSYKIGCSLRLQTHLIK